MTRDELLAIEATPYGPRALVALDAITYGERSIWALSTLADWLDERAASVGVRPTAKNKRDGLRVGSYERIMRCASIRRGKEEATIAHIVALDATARIAESCIPEAFDPFIRRHLKRLLVRCHKALSVDEIGDLAKIAMRLGHEL